MAHHTIAMPPTGRLGRPLALCVVGAFVLLSLGMAHAQAPASAQVSGEIVFPEPFPRSDHVRVLVTLQDVSRSDAASVTLAEHVIDRMAATPVPFAISYDPDLIKPSHAYTIAVEVYVKGPDGQFRRGFRTMQSYPVLTRGAGRALQVRVERIRE
jgi:uncharacterized lipoprotein YbaY